MAMLLEPKQVQQHQITLQMEQSLKILQMDYLELVDYVQNLALENPVMEVELPQHQMSPVPSQKLKWLTSDEYCAAAGNLPDEEEADWRNDFFDAEETLEDYLKEQIGYMKLPAVLMRDLLYLVECLDDNGYLPAGLKELSLEAGIPESRLLSAWEVLKGMDPPGIGATTLNQCILLQLERRGTLDGALARVVENYLEPLARGNYQLVAQKIGESVETVRGYARRIKETNPKPCAAIGRPREVRYVIPDLVVERFADRLNIVLSEETVPRIVINRDYLRMLDTESDFKTRRYLNGKLRQADWVARSIEGRLQTLLSVGKLLIKKQRDFFLHGPKHLKSLNLSDIAEELHLHPSTISRAAKGKYLECQYGSFPLKYFFTPGVNREAGKAVTGVGIKERIKEIIEAENPRSPVSDQEIAGRLASLQMEISRRTVAKYRDQLGIPSASVRKAGLAQ